MTFHAGSRWFQSGPALEQEAEEEEENKRTTSDLGSSDRAGSAIIHFIKFFLSQKKFISFSNNNWISVVEHSSFFYLYFFLKTFSRW